MIKKIVFCICSLSILVFTSCEKDKLQENTPPPNNLNGVFVVNEGVFQAGNASISFFSSDSVYSNGDLYQTVNGFPVGDLLQSMSIYNGKAYLCVNNSQKVEVVSMVDFTKTASIYEINSPRYFTAQSNYGYISDWNSNQVFKINLNSNTIVDSVLCGLGPEEMLIANNQLFVCNSGGFADDSSVTVVNLSTFNVATTITSGVNPSSIRKDNTGNVWVLCRGSLGADFTPTPDDPGGKLMKINPTSLATEWFADFNFDEHPIKLNTNADGTTLYFLFGNSAYTGTVYKMDASSTVIPSTPYINREFYALGIHPTDESIYGGKASFSSNSHMLHYTNGGVLIDSSTVGIGPSSFVFN